MALIEVPKGTGDWFVRDPAPPHWWPFSWSAATDVSGNPVLGAALHTSAVLSCPKCGCVGSLRAHDIAPDGVVRPSVLMSCEHGDPCWHSENPGVRLLGWSP